jgi:hypothetical protein
MKRKPKTATITTKYQLLKYPTGTKSLTLLSAEFSLPIRDKTHLLYEGIKRHSLTKEQIEQGAVVPKRNGTFVCILPTNQKSTTSCFFEISNPMNREEESNPIDVSDLLAISFKIESDDPKQKAKISVSVN